MTLDKLLPALFKAQGELEHAKKTSDNPHFKSKYADLATVLDTVKPVMQANGLLVTHAREVVDLNEYLVTTLYHAASGQSISSRTLLQPLKRDPQGYGSAITYARRYDLSALLGLAQDDDDGNGASQPKAETAASRNKRFKSIKDDLLDSHDITTLQHNWQVSQPAIVEFKNTDEQFYTDLVNAKEQRKKELVAKDLEEAGYPQGFNKITSEDK